MLVCLCWFSLDQNNGQSGESEGEGIRWTSSLDRNTKDLQKEGQEKTSLKRMKQLHKEKVLSIHTRYEHTHITSNKRLMHS